MKGIFIGVSAIALTATAAHAQVSTAPPVPAAQDGTALDETGIAEVIVTAQRIETTLQRTPQAITAISGDALQRAGVATAQDLSKLVTGLNVESNGSNSAIFIRGIGSRTLTAVADPAIAFGVDGVFYSRAQGLSSQFLDLERVEAVKGPQGTLYGRNATGGAINLITRRPKLGELGLVGEFEVGNYEAIRAFAAVNVPLGERAALRLAAQSTYNSGYMSDGYNDTNIKVLRASLVFEPTGRLSVFASVDYSRQEGQGPGYIPIGPSTLPGGSTTRFIVPDDPFTGASDPRINAALQAVAPPQRVPGPNPNTIYCRAQVVGPPTPAGVPARPLCGNPLGIDQITADGYLANEFFGGNLTVDADLGFATLTAIGGYRGTDIDTLQRVELGRQQLRSTADQYSAEVRLASNRDATGPLKWVVGGFYLREDQTSFANIESSNMAVPAPGAFCATVPVAGFCVAAPPLIQNRLVLSDPDITSETYAGFGQATLSLTDWFRVTGGIRYTHEKKAEQGGSTTLVYLVPAGLTRTYPSVGSVKFNDTSYRAGVELDVGPRSMAYAHYSTGFHAGGFNLGVENGPNTFYYQPEKVKSYVVGIKNRFFQNRVQLNIEGFRLDYNNYQFTSLGFINDGSPTCVAVRTACPLTVRTDNARGARLQGVEADLVWRVFSEGTLDVNVLYNDAKYRSFDVANAFTGAITSYAGVQLPSANKWTIGGGYTHRFPLANGGGIVADARTQYRDGTFIWYTRLPSQYQEGYTRTDLTLGYEAPDQRYSFRVFVRNLEDKATTFQGATVNATTGYMFSVLNPPRTYGAALGFKF